jgi:hypothetical protein
MAERCFKRPVDLFLWVVTAVKGVRPGQQQPITILINTFRTSIQEKAGQERPLYVEAI